ncbi:hypothetical protein MA20_45470 [Bradyrhizobium japonicum]|uniref:Uncharacterized protein n=1 Tax=Bradyrhizobium japonicum TaxID=375 RepID=A0A0A3YHR5_BRAJP|nr:hypothetical protein MA20_45470 [Bradyrhizobium japonicum]
MYDSAFNKADELLFEGAPPDQIDAVLTKFGMPFVMGDMAGLDIGWLRAKIGVSNPRYLMSCARQATLG